MFKSLDLRIPSNSNVFHTTSGLKKWDIAGRMMKFEHFSDYGEILTIQSTQALEIPASLSGEVATPTRV